jgi:hypothetical protein
MTRRPSHFNIARLAARAALPVNASSTHPAEEYQHVKKLLFPIFALVAMLCTAAQSPAQTAKPVVIVSLAGYDELMSDVDFIGQITGMEQMLSASMVEANINQVTNNQGLKGLDKKKPWGAAVLTDGNSFTPLVFLPVKDVKGLVESFAIFGFSASDEGNGLLKVQGPPQAPPAFAKTQGDYTFFAQNADQLKTLPQNPETLLEGLNKEYDIGVRAYVQNVPEFWRNMVTSQLKMGMQMSLQNPAPGEDQQAFEIRKQLVQQQLQQFDTMLKELDTFTVGAKIDGAAKTAHLDIGVAVKEGGAMAKQLGQMSDLKTEHAGFLLPEAAVNLNFVSIAGPDDIKQAVAMIKSLETRAATEIDKDNSFPNDEVRKTAKEIIGDLVQVAVKTLQSGRIDGGATLFLSPGSATVVAGGTVVDGASIESALKKLVNLAQGEIPEVKFNAGTYKDITLHTMSIPVPDAEAQKVFGEAAEVVVGIGSKTVHVAFGRNAIDTLKKVVDQSAAQAAKSVPPVQLIAALEPIIKFANSIEPNPAAEVVADELSKSSGKDHVSLVGRLEKNGFVYRLKAEEGVLRAIGAAGKAAGGL